MPSYGLTAAGFAVKPLSQILLDIQTQILGTVDAELDLSPQTPDGQITGIFAAAAAGIWELLGTLYEQYKRRAAEGASLDNVGDISGIPREGPSYTQVFCTVTLAAGTYTAGQLQANVVGNSSLVFSNFYPITSTGGTTTGVLFQCTVIGPTPTINPGTLTAITTPVTGFTAITNPEAQSQLGTNTELDPAFMARQIEELAREGSCNPSATAAAIIQVGAEQQPPQTLTVSVPENTTEATLVVSGVSLPAHSYSPVIYDGGTGWATTTAGKAAIGQVIYNNMPTGIAPIGTTTVTIIDPNLGTQSVFFTVPTALPLFIDVTVVARVGVNFTTLQTAIQNALIAAATAPTPAGGTPPPGQMAPGSPVIGSQLEAVVMGVSGVFDVQALTFGFSGSPSNTAPLTLTAVQIATVSAANINVIAGTYP